MPQVIFLGIHANFLQFLGYSLEEIVQTLFPEPVRFWLLGNNFLFPYLVPEENKHEICMQKRYDVKEKNVQPLRVISKPDIDLSYTLQSKISIGLDVFLYVPPLVSAHPYFRTHTFKGFYKFSWVRLQSNYLWFL